MSLRMSKPATHAHGKVPSHCVVTELRDVALLQAAARQAGAVAVSVAEYDVRDQACGNGDQHIVRPDLHPLLAVRGRAQVV